MRKALPPAGDQVKKLRELCEQADRLQKAAARLCKELTQAIEKSKAAHPERRRLPRHR